MRSVKLIGGLFLAILIAGCVDDSKDIPKPYGYFRIEFPEHKYEVYTDPNCPYTFEKPVNALLIDKNDQGTKCFKSLVYPHLKAGVYFTYFPVNDNVDQLIKTADDVVYEHHNMAAGIETMDINYPEKKVYGISYKLMGNVAVNHVFFVTDSNNHYFAGKLYFESIPNYDSLQPCIDYIVEDIEHILNTIQWQLPMPVNQID